LVKPKGKKIVKKLTLGSKKASKKTGKCSSGLMVEGNCHLCGCMNV
jgi:hypothetical protein